MAIGTLATAALISAGIKGGVDIYKARRAGNAAEKAADTQAAAGQQAIGTLTDFYNQGRADLAPWRDTGGQAMTSLGAMMGLPSGPVGGGAPMSSVGSAAGIDRPGARGEGTPTGVATARPPGMTPPGRGSFSDWVESVKASQGAADRGDVATIGQQARTRSSLASPSPSGASSLIRIADDEGNEMDLQPEIAEALIARGARRVGG